MKTVTINHVRQQLAHVIAELQASDEAVVVLEHSRPAAYFISARRYERDQAERGALRRAVFLGEVQDVEGEFRAGDARSFDDVEQLIHQLG
ncbi:MAG TPA: type II toxin-antitoxin system Phd/YefM family antitoxin [Candidatus Sulfotelmatobacter sp.]|nr:type II toxin-antitoxin system Phd/YefM family antitoxin [Candidatus Sulfotelmatobacter sp.]